ncbi:MAG: NAD(P)H-dependent glycerol-3-phosphate dehydrogenase [Desulfobulbus sp.]|jgi:glycerol-3-phosphate dehydrogenase (NAD(P)+)
MKMRNVAVIGAGSWGTSLALLLARKGQPVTLWDKNTEHIEQVGKDRENKRYHPGHRFPDILRTTADLAEAVRDAECVVMVVPSHGYRAVYRDLFPSLAEGTFVVSAVKGIEIASGSTMVGIMEEESAPGKKVHFGVLSGPSFAAEVAEGKPTAVTVAFADSRVAEVVQHLFSTDWFRVYSSNDLIGLEICGAMKNVIAIAAGICDGLNYGLNTRAALMTRGLAEITRMGVAMGGQAATFAGLGGMGDLVLTCTGDLSRNRTVGLKLGSGKTLEQALSEMKMVAEGVKTTESCHALAKRLEIEMPILEQVYQVLYSGKKCEEAVNELFQRQLKPEI